MLPTEKNKPKSNLLDYTILLYGQPKIGKSSLISQVDNVLFANTEGGLSAIECYSSEINSWNNGEGSFLQLCSDFTKTEHNFKTLCIDTVDVLHKLCVEYIINNNNITHPSDLEWGKGYEMVKDEFLRPLTKLAVSKYGLIFITHSHSVEITTRISKFTKMTPTLVGYIWKQLEAFVDIILFFDSEITDEGEKRFIRTKPSEKWIAGDRTTKLLKADPIEIDKEGNNWKKIENIFNGDVPEAKKRNGLIIS